MRRGVNGVIPFAMELVLLQVGFHCFSYIDERARNGGIQKQFLGVVLFSWQWVAGERVETGGIRHERRGSETLHLREAGGERALSGGSAAVRFLVLEELSDAHRSAERTLGKER